jgi:hypothetical protein
MSLGKPALIAVFALLTMAPVGSAASDDQNPPPSQPPAGQQPVTTGASTAPKKPDLTGWWHKSSMDYHPLPSEWLFHAEGTFSVMDATGNTDGTSLDISGSTDLRKYRFTSHSFAQLTRKSIDYLTTRTSVDYTERTLREQVDFDITAHLMLLAGVEAYRNTLMFMDERVNVYGGVGATVFRDKKHQFNLVGALGHATFDFDRSALLRVNPGAGGLDTKPSSGGAIAMQIYRWTPSTHFNFSQDSSYMKYFQTDLGYRWTVNLTGNVPISKAFSVNVSYRLKKESNSIIDALRVFREDRTFLMGIKVSI